MVLRGNNLEIKFGLVFFIKTPLKQSSNDKMLPSFKAGAIYLLTSTYKSLKPLFGGFFGKLCNLRQQCHNYTPSTWITPTNTCPTKNSNRRCLGDVAFECHANFRWVGNHFHIGINKKTYLGNVALKPQRWQMSRFDSCIGSIVNQLRAHSHIWTNPKITNYIESRLSTWQYTTYLNMN